MPPGTDLALACRDLGGLYEDGHGVPKNEARAVALYKKGCETDDSEEWKHLACLAFGKATLFQQSCQRGYAPVCEELKQRGR